jgi:hypothetical protein
MASVGAVGERALDFDGANQTTNKWRLRVYLSFDIGRNFNAENSRVEQGGKTSALLIRASLRHMIPLEGLKTLTRRKVTRARRRIRGLISVKVTLTSTATPPLKLSHIHSTVAATKAEAELRSCRQRAATSNQTAEVYVDTLNTELVRTREEVTATVDTKVAASPSSIPK